MEIFGAVWDSLQTVWAPWVINYTINYVLVCRRPELAIGIGLKKVEPMLDEWATHGQPTVLFRDC